MTSDAFLHERSNFKALVETVADGEKINDPALVEKDYWIMHAAPLYYRGQISLDKSSPASRRI
jgi:hypothetical protein